MKRLAQKGFMSVIMTIRPPIFSVATPNASAIAQTVGAQRDAIIKEHDAATLASKAWEHTGMPRFRWAIGDPSDPHYAPVEAQREAMLQASAAHDVDFIQFAKAHR